MQLHYCYSIINNNFAFNFTSTLLLNLNTDKMKKINLKEFEELVNSYASSEIDKPLLVFGESYEDLRWKTTEKLLGDSYWKITLDNDEPRADIPYCLYNTYYGKVCNSTLQNCYNIASRIHRPVFCFIDNSVKEQVPEELLKNVDIYEFIDD